MQTIDMPRDLELLITVVQVVLRQSILDSHPLQRIGFPSAMRGSLFSFTNMATANVSQAEQVRVGGSFLFFGVTQIDSVFYALIILKGFDRFEPNYDRTFGSGGGFLYPQPVRIDFIGNN